MHTPACKNAIFCRNMQQRKRAMTRLSVNINKVALIRNSRGSNLPDLVSFALDCEEFGAQGITVHPRPDERHIKYQDVYDLKPVLHTEFNIEGYPNEHFLEMVEKVKPAQCTLVPDPPYALTSDSGWDTVEKQEFLKEVVSRLHSAGVRVSIFLDPDPSMVEGAAKCGTDRIELYTGDYAKGFYKNKEVAVAPHVETARLANQAGLGVNAGHDLNLENLKYYSDSVPSLLEVSIGHALICDSLYYGIQNVIGMYLRLLY